MKNKVASIHKDAEVKRAMVEAKRAEQVLKAEEMAAKYPATNTTPKKLLGCFSSRKFFGHGMESKRAITNCQIHIFLVCSSQVHICIFAFPLVFVCCFVCKPLCNGTGANVKS
ncbi:hypothetical protein ACOSP7_003674 [Xanthoceras sorbifolium]